MTEDGTSSENTGGGGESRMDWFVAKREDAAEAQSSNAAAGFWEAEEASSSEARAGEGSHCALLVANTVFYCSGRSQHCCSSVILMA